MAAPNSQPLFSRVPDIQWAESCVTANNTLDLAGAVTNYLVFTADATNGGFVREIRVKANPANNTAASVIRFWINNGSVVTVAANSAIFGELGLPATVASASVAMPDFIYPVNFPLPPGYKIYATLGTAPGGSGEFTITAIGGKYEHARHVRPCAEHGQLPNLHGGRTTHGRDHGLANVAQA